MSESRNHYCRIQTTLSPGHTALKPGPAAIELVDIVTALQRLGAAENKEQQVMTKPLKQVSRRIVWFLLCAILVGWFAHDGRAQTAVFPPPSPDASSCSATGANWLTCNRSEERRVGEECRSR